MKPFNYKSLGFGPFLGIGVIAGILNRIFLEISFFELGLLIRLLFLPCILIFLSFHLISKGYSKKITPGVWGLCSIILSNLISIIIYGMLSGWWYVFEDSESQIIISVLVLAQLAIYTIGYIILLIALVIFKNNRT